jgi:tRNA U34 5-methylaminomethyl-2-thiouridine-forming methyltransferase MnmC
VNYTVDNNFDLVYFDAFAPDKQTGLWEQPVFRKLFDAMNHGGILVTYCAKGEVRRTLTKCGFTVQRLPGPPGKREMLRGIKND